MANDFEDEVYDDSINESPKDQLDDDEITPEEEGFMKGYDSAYDETVDEDDLDKEFE
ncbi:hypothetical protein HN789_02740 [archaeon]|jgi:hypothetical protein|nr:hypothetical protein [archaeon]MBT4021975.1 hypothetical protein [archaeon]MBT4272291.1 hypothetical protein [archaeon]MBT4460827.1 hypothetical protein [archaeon]MBT4858394.1 hypothetical protein [archaeon]